MPAYGYPHKISIGAADQFIKEVNKLFELLLKVQTSEIDVIETNDVINIVDLFYFNQASNMSVDNIDKLLDDKHFCKAKDEMFRILMHEVSKGLLPPGICNAILKGETLSFIQYANIYSIIVNKKLNLIETLIVLAPMIRTIEQNDYDKMDESWLLTLSNRNFQHVDHIVQDALKRIDVLNTDPYGCATKLHQIIALHENNLTNSRIYETTLRRRMGWLAYYAWANYSVNRSELGLT
jgi:hypothetical protein